MAATLKIEQKEAYLHAFVTGENIPENIFAYLMDIRDACERLGCPRVLIEEHLSGPSLDIKSIFQIVSLASQHVEPAVKQIAFVDTNPEHDPIKMEFAENVAVGLGIQIRVFATIDEARRWLVESSTGVPGAHSSR